MSGWPRVIEGFAPKISDECRAGILVGSRLPVSGNPDAALAVQQWAAAGLLSDSRIFVLPHYD